MTEPLADIGVRRWLACLRVDRRNSLVHRRNALLHLVRALGTTLASFELLYPVLGRVRVVVRPLFADITQIA